MKMTVLHQIGWMPVRAEEGDTSVYRLRCERDFIVRPSVGEQVMVFGELFKVANFYHDTDANELVAHFVQEWAHSPDEAVKRKDQLVQLGWSV